MSASTVDRRIQRTRTALQHAFLSLIGTKDYEAITIQDICDAANVGRSTFYAHYTGKDDLKRSGLEHLRRMLLERQRHAPDVDGRPMHFSLAMFEHARDHLHHYKALVGSTGGPLVMQTIRDILTDLVRREPVIARLKAGAEREMSVQYIVGAFMAVLQWWFEAGTPSAAADIDARFRRMILASIEVAE